MPEPKSHKIQELLRPRSGFPSALYEFTSKSSEARPSSGEVFITLGSGDIYSGNSYFNSLYLDYWRQYTSVQNVGVEIELLGSAEIQVFGCSADGQEILLASLVSDAGKKKTIERLWLQPDELHDQAENKIGRLYVKINANSDVSILGMAFITDTVPNRSVNLSIGLCTFKREENLAITLAALLELRESCSSIRKITIVNHGEQFSNVDLLENITALDADIITQSNFGGCGGFNRTMYEIDSDDHGCSHHLLMDDDIELDPRIISRSISFLSYSHEKIVVGGHMLETTRPTVLFEAGGRLDPFWYVHPLGRDEDMAQDNAGNFFASVLRPDFNAWWYCIFPVEAIREIGYSPPIFIHGDDIEYGCRLGDYGYETVALPGIAVWHEPFAAKNGDWFQYYDFRNRLIVSSTQEIKWRQPDTLYCFGFIMNMLLMHRYRSVGMYISGMNDFLDGPEKLFSVGADDTHARVTSIGENLDKVWLRTDIDPSAYEKGNSEILFPSQIRIAIDFFLSFMMILLLPLPKKPSVIHDKYSAKPAVIRHQPYLLVADSKGESHLEFHPSKRSLIVGALKAVAVSMRYMLRRRSITKVWKEKLPEHQTREAWKQIFFG